MKHNFFNPQQDELHYILTLKEIHVEDITGETFRVLKDNEVRLCREYRTLRLVLNAWVVKVKDESGRLNGFGKKPYDGRILV